MLKLHVVLAVDRAGLVGEDGETHHGVFDIGLLRHAPGMRILCPASCEELSQMLTWAVEEYHGPVAIRYPRGGDRGYSDSHWKNHQSLCCHRKGSDLTILTYGPLTQQVIKASEILAEQGIEATVLRLLTVAPLDTEAIVSCIAGNHLLIVEETNTECAIAKDIFWHLQSAQPACKVASLDLGSHFVTHGSLEELYRHYGLSGDAIAQFVRKEHFYENQKATGCAPD